jgi:ribosomal protein L37AE/L43A
MSQMFQYKIAEGRKIWLCRECKKAKNHLILIHYLRLIDRQDNSELTCDECGTIPAVGRAKSWFGRERLITSPR